MRTRKGSSLCVYQIAVKMVSPGVTTASSNPRKKLGTDNRVPEWRRIALNGPNVAPISHETREVVASRSSGGRSAMLSEREPAASRT